MARVIVCDRCGDRIESGYNTTGAIRRLGPGGRLTMVLESPGDWCSPCLVGLMVSSGGGGEPELVITEDTAAYGTHLPPVPAIPPVTAPPAEPPPTVSPAFRRERPLV